MVARVLRVTDAAEAQVVQTTVEPQERTSVTVACCVADEEAYDELKFKMVNGDSFTKRVPAGAARSIFEDVSEGGWIDVDEETRIRRAHVVSVSLRENAHEEFGRMVSWGDVR
jgi:hypothetical protein